MCNDCILQVKNVRLPLFTSTGDWPRSKMLHKAWRSSAGNRIPGAGTVLPSPRTLKHSSSAQWGLVLTPHYTNADSVTRPLLAPHPISLSSFTSLLCTSHPTCVLLSVERCQKNVLSARHRMVVCVATFSEVTLWINHAPLRGVRGVARVAKSLTTAEGESVRGCGCLQGPSLTPIPGWQCACVCVSSPLPGL